MLPPSENLSADKTIAEKERLPATSHSALQRPAEVSSSLVYFNYITVIYLLVIK